MSGWLQNTSALLQGIGTITAMIAFIGICLWAYSGKRKQQFDEAANLPFADDDRPVDPAAEKRRTRNPQS